MPAEPSPEPSPELGVGIMIGSGDDASALLSRLRVIEDQPLQSRAVAFVHIHNRLQSTLEGSVRDGTRDGGVGASNLHG